jgi:hypothetical protein
MNNNLPKNYVMMQLGNPMLGGVKFFMGVT